MYWQGVKEDSTCVVRLLRVNRRIVALLAILRSAGSPLQEVRNLLVNLLGR